MSMENVLVIGDTHLPFEKKGYLDFCLDVKRIFKCGQVVHIGDLVDNHAISYHEHDPDGMSAGDEGKAVDKSLKEWFKAFPKLKLCKGNHDLLSARRSRTDGIPKRHIREFEESWNLPKTWDYGWQFYISNVKYQHGTGFSGNMGHMAAALSNRQSTVIGHIHSSAGHNYLANDLSMIFGMNVGCGIDRKKYSFWYGKDFKNKPIISCGVVLNSGTEAHVLPMKI